MDTKYVLSLSYGKDSLACLGAIEKLKLPLDRIVHAEVWATDSIPADLPPMVEFKKKADKIIKERWGIEVEHFCAMRGGRKLTYNEYFYHKRVSGEHQGDIKGFPVRKGQWCTQLKTGYGMQNNLRTDVLSGEHEKASNIWLPDDEGKLVFETEAPSTKRNGRIGVIQYLGIAEDEPERLARLDGVTKISPLQLIGWDEADAKRWCIENELLSPIYTDTCLRGGCWFCHNQGVQQLRELRHNYPDLWALMMKWDSDSPVTFRADGHTVHDFDKRFMLEDLGMISAGMQWRWEYLNKLPNVQIGIFKDEVYR